MLPPSRFLCPLVLSVTLSMANAVSAQQNSAISADLPAGCQVNTAAVSEADRAFYAEDWGKASRLYHDALKNDPANQEAQAGLVRVALGQDHVADAETTALALVNANPRSAVAHTILGEVYLWRGEIELAPEPVSKALSLDPCSARAHYAEGRLAAIMGYHATAAHQFAISHALDPQDDQLSVAWMFTLPPTQRFSILKDFLEHVPYLNDDDREDMKSQVVEGELRMNSGCTVSAPPAGTHTKLYLAPNLSHQPGLPTLDAALNGGKHRAAFDTSANGVVLPWGTAERLGLKPLAHTSYALLYGSGRIHYYLAKLDSLRIGEVEYRNCIVSVVDERPGSGLYDSHNMTGADLRIGATFLSDFLIRMDPAHETLALTPLPALTGPKTDSSGLPLWSTAPQTNEEPVPSINGGSWGQYNRVVPASMKDWTPLFRYRNETWVGSRVGAGPNLLFELELADPWPRISTNAAPLTAKLESVHPGKTPFKGYFLSFGGLYFPIDSWTAVRYDEYSKHMKIETSGTIGQDALRQLSITLDLRDNLVHFERQAR